MGCQWVYECYSGFRPVSHQGKSFGACTGTWTSISPAVEKPSGSALEGYLVGSAVVAGTFSDPAQATQAPDGPCTSLQHSVQSATTLAIWL